MNTETIEKGLYQSRLVWAVMIVVLLIVLFIPHIILDILPNITSPGFPVVHFITNDSQA